MPTPEIETLRRAYHAAGRALDIGMRRRGGATKAEWQAEDDARIILRAACRVHAQNLREIIRESGQNNERLAAGLLAPKPPIGVLPAA
jgi:hypothetical protein